MLVLTAENEIVQTDHMSEGDEVYCSVLSFQDLKEPDFYFKIIEFLNEFSSASVVLHIGEHKIVMPLHWSILCTDLENVQSIPLSDVSGKNFASFCLNPIDGFIPELLRVKLGTIFPNSTWTSPQLNDKDMLVVPLGKTTRKVGEGVQRGPVCAIFSASKFEIYKPISDIW